MPAHSLRSRFKATVAEAILDAAEAIAADLGVPATSLQAVAKRAGVAVGTIYNHFEDRGELFAALWARRREQLAASLDALAKKTNAQPFEAQLEQYVHAVFAFFDTNRAFLQLALDHAPKIVAKGSKAGSMEQLTARAERIVRVGVKEKRLRDGAKELAPHLLVAVLRAVLITKADDPKPLVEWTAQTVSLFLRGAGK